MIKKIIWKLLCVLERDEMRSRSLRYVFERFFAVKVGAYSYGCFDYKRFPPGTIVGRYCSIARQVYIFNANHTSHFLCQHPFFYSKNYGLIDEDKIERIACQIEDDVWLGHNVTILSGVKRIGRGSIVGAGAVVVADVPRYSIVLGMPGKVVKYRFDDDIIKSIEETRWWEKSEQELKVMVKTNPDMFFEPNYYFARK